MRCNWLRWFWGLLPLGLLVAFTYSSTHETIQADLKSRTELALRAHGLDWANTGFSGRDGHLAGRASSEDDQGLAVDVVKRVWGVRVADDRSALIERADTFLWNASLAGRAVRLTGFVPNERTRRAVIKAAQEIFPSTEVIDEMKPARGAPPEDVWTRGVTFGLTQLARLETGGQVSLRDHGFLINGQARTVNDFENVRGALAQALPSGVILERNGVVPPVMSPYAGVAKYEGSSLTLEGFIPDDKARDAILTAGKAAFPNAAIIDRMTIAGGAPADWTAAIGVVLAATSELKSARAEFRDRAVRVTGLAVQEETALAVGRTLRAKVPAGYQLDHDIKFEKPSIPEVKPYDTSISVTDKEIVLAGHVPSEAQRLAILEYASAAFPGRSVVDRVLIARGQHEGWSVCINRGLEAIKQVGNGRLSLSDDNLVLRGETEDAALASSLPGAVRASTSRSCRTDVNLALTVAPEPNLEWQALRDGERVVLTGEVPDSDTRALIAAKVAALFPKAEIDDRSRVNPAKSKSWGQVAIMGLDLVSLLRRGSATIKGQELKIVGEARDAVAVTAIRQRLKSALAKGYSGSEMIEIRSDAMIWAEQEARRKAEQDSKARAEAEKRQQELDDAKRRVEAERARAEEARLADQKRRADEARRAEQAAEARRKAVESRGQAAQMKCQTALDAVRTSGQINFELASSEISRSSFALLDRLASAARTCEDVTIEIEGHTDSQGTDQDNLELSQRRAESVAAYLVGAGVAQDRVTAVGFGESRPIVPNTTLENRAQNRRIEFVVRQR